MEIDSIRQNQSIWTHANGMKFTRMSIMERKNRWEWKMRSAELAAQFLWTETEREMDY